VQALQEASMRTSRAANAGTYRAFRKIVYMIIEDIRQFYDAPRQFRIIGENGVPQYIFYSNANIKPVEGMTVMGVPVPPRRPEFDIDVTAEKQSADTKAAMNELGLTLFKMGMLNPMNAEESLIALESMDFKGRDEIIQKINKSQTLAAQLAKWQNVAIAIANQNNPDLAQQLAVLAAGQAQQANQRTAMPNGANLTEQDKVNIPPDPGAVPA
jgi:hypothetical protein